jgi:hypothetical protein
MLRKRQSGATLDDVVELLHGIGRILMEISARLEALSDFLRGENDEETDT